MDLRLFGRVMWRFRLVVGAGFVIALSLSFLTLFRVSASQGISLRTAPLYQSSATLFVTEPGFPWGSATQPYAPPQGGTAVPKGDLARLTALATLYVNFANGDKIAAIVARTAPRKALVSAVQGYSVTPGGDRITLPTIVVNGTASSRAGAMATAQIGVDALIAYVRRHQLAAGIPHSDRVLIQELNRPTKLTTVVVKSTKMTLPIVVFLAIMLAVTALVFALENLRPSGPRALPANPEDESRPESARRTA